MKPAIQGDNRNAIQYTAHELPFVPQRRGTGEMGHRSIGNDQFAVDAFGKLTQASSQDDAGSRLLSPNTADKIRRLLAAGVGQRIVPTRLDHCTAAASAASTPRTSA